MGRWSISLLIAASACAGIALANCPDAASLTPCTCDHEGMNCMRANNTAQLEEVFRSGSEATREHNQLWIQRTPITSFPAGVLGEFKFEEVHVERNANLTSFTMDSLVHFRELLNVLSLYGNALRTFEFGKLRRFPYLQVINLGANQLTRIPDNAFRNKYLERLGLNDNPITFIGQRAFHHLSSLKHLDLSGTRVTTLGPYSLSVLRAHPEFAIDLDNSGIGSIHRNAFDYAAPLVLSLRNNRLATLEENPFRPLIERMYQNAQRTGTLPVINVKGNPLTCRGCSYKWLVHYKSFAQVRAILYDLQCPDGSGLSSLSDQKIDCRTSWSFANIG
nr:leucine-rich repeat-containing protein 70-like [Rhipicephalus microplus]